MSNSGLPDRDALVSLPSASITSKLKGMLPENPFHIKGTEAEKIASELGISKYQLMVELIPIARAFAVTPISKFNVGSCAMGLSGDFYLGANIEFVGDNLSQTIHSEQCSSFSAFCHGEKGLSYLAVTSEPCGYCRQYLNEMAGRENLNIMIPEKPIAKLEDLLPRSFGPSDLGIEAGMPCILENAISLENVDDEIVKIALEAANRTYAPYSHCNAGICFEFTDGTSVSSYYLENAAFSPSLAPTQAAFIMTVASGHKWSDIKRAVLVEREGCGVTHTPSFNSVVRANAPQAQISVYYGK